MSKGGMIRIETAILGSGLLESTLEASPRVQRYLTGNKFVADYDEDVSGLPMGILNVPVVMNPRTSRLVGGS